MDFTGPLSGVCRALDRQINQPFANIEKKKTKNLKDPHRTSRSSEIIYSILHIQGYVTNREEMLMCCAVQK